MSKFSEEKVEEFRRVYDMFDQNQDGKVSSKELGQLMRALGLNPTNKELNEIMAEVDQSGNSFMEFEEFLVYMEKNWPERDPEAELREAFQILDRDKSGYISISELKQIMLNMGERLTQEELEDMMREVDADGDGKIQYEEFVTKLTAAI